MSARSLERLGITMDERRKNKRTLMDSSIVIKKLDNEDHREVAINITDVSKVGIGFECEEVLSIGDVYESFLTIWTKEVIHAFLQIVRIELGSSGYVYGASFIGMPEIDSARIEVYQTINDNE